MGKKNCHFESIGQKKLLTFYSTCYFLSPFFFPLLFYIKIYNSAINNP